MKALLLFVLAALAAICWSYIVPDARGADVGAGALAGGLMAWALGSWRSRRQAEARMSEVTQAVRRLAGGDLSLDEGQHGRLAELPALREALESLRATLFDLIARVRAGTTSVASSAGMLAVDNAALASRTEGQATALEETVSAMEQLAATVRQMAENASAASAMMAATTESAGRGSGVVVKVVDSMDAIRERSSRAAEIISVMDGIAFQTNILALNAAVEAARAGEEGRGFAVVAGEVRSLAQRAAEGAREVRSLIADSADRIGVGSRLVAEAGVAMEEIMDHVTRVAGLMGEIAAAAAEQSAGIDEINHAVLQIDGMTQDNARLVHEVTQTAAGLQEEAEQLTEGVERFRLGLGEFGNEQEASALVHSAAAFMQAHGRDALVQEVKRLRKGRFADRDLYLSLYGLDGRVAAHGASRRFWDIDWTQFKDADGRLFIAEMVAAAKAAANGWIRYKWVHPVSKQTSSKMAYFERCGDLVIACGIFEQGGA